MNDAIWQEIMEAECEGCDSQPRLQQGLMAIAAALGDIAIPRERWLAMGHHMAEVVNRSSRREQLDDLDEDTMAQIDPSCVEQSRTILWKLSEEGDTMRRPSEIVLLAIHLQCAAEGF